MANPSMMRKGGDVECAVRGRVIAERGLSLVSAHEPQKLVACPVLREHSSATHRGFIPG